MTCTVPRLQLNYATFALGRYVQYRLDEGTEEHYLHEFMDAYFILTAALEDREPLSRAELQAHSAATTPRPQESGFLQWPTWLLPHERVLRYLQQHGSGPNTAAHHALCECPTCITPDSAPPGAERG